MRAACWLCKEGLCFSRWETQGQDGSSSIFKAKGSWLDKAKAGDVLDTVQLVKVVFKLKLQADFGEARAALDADSWPECVVCLGGSPLAPRRDSRPRDRGCD